MSTRPLRRAHPGRAWLVPLAITLLLAAGCTSLPAAPEAVGEPAPLDFRLGVGDRIRIGLWGEQQFEHELEVGPDGRVSLPLIGAVPLGGLTLDEARIALAQRYKAQYVEPVVTLGLIEARSMVVHVLGEVVRPSTVSFARGATVLGAIVAAGGFRPATADVASVQLVRQRLGQEPQAFAIDIEAIMAGLRADTWLQPGDVVFVPARAVTSWYRWWQQAMPWGDGAEPGGGGD
jgi:polysaccharide export outer membrane protein